MNHKNTDFKNQKFGRLEARVKDKKNQQPGTYWWFLCDCGSYVSIRVTNVLNGRTKSCGCLRKDYFIKLRSELQDNAALKKALDIAMRCLSEPGCYQRFDNEMKAINEILYGKTGE